jgi:two-component system, chemotaxis family, protein-glutamate methylesterase/glutaminase
MKTKKILIVDDSKIIQKLLYTVLSKEPDFEIIGICSDPFEAEDYLNTCEVDCIVLDLEMPKMDGATFLKKMMKAHPMQIIIFSEAASENPSLCQKLLDIGAHAVFAKSTDMDKTFDRLKSSIRQNYFSLTEKLGHSHFSLQHIILIAASTGGTDGVKKILNTLPYSRQISIIVIQHMAAVFTKKFAATLSLTSSYNVKEAENEDILSGGTAYVAAGNFHLEIVKKTTQFFLQLNQKNPVHSVRPAADVTFLNFPEALALKSTTIILSGMGKDGAQGILHLKKHGSRTIAESESSSVVFGMPKAAIATGCVDHILSIEDICSYLVNEFNQSKAS